MKKTALKYLLLISIGAAAGFGFGWLSRCAGGGA